MSSKDVNKTKDTPGLLWSLDHKVVPFGCACPVGAKAFLEQAKSVSEKYNAPVMLIVVPAYYGGRVPVTCDQSIRFYKLSKTNGKRGRLAYLESCTAERLFSMEFGDYYSWLPIHDGFGGRRLTRVGRGEAVIMLYVRGALKAWMIMSSLLYDDDGRYHLDKDGESLIIKPEYNKSWRRYLNNMEPIKIANDLIEF